MTDAYILGGVRTPVGRYGGALSHIRTDDLLGQTMVAACERLGVPLEKIEDITAGCVNVAHEGMGDITRWGALAAGFPDSVPAVTVNRFCASSLTGAISIAHAIRSGRRRLGRGLLHHVLDRGLIIRPAGAIAEVLIGELPPLQGIGQAGAEAPHLLVRRDVQEQLDEADAGIDQHVLELVDLPIGAAPLPRRGKALDPLHQDAAIP